MFGAMLTLAIVLLMIHSSENRLYTGSAQKYCGSELTNTLSLLCNGIYKRTPHTHFDYEEPLTDYNNDELSELFKDRSRALSMMSKQKFRNKRGVATECCFKSCTITELTSYCGTSDS